MQHLENIYFFFNHCLAARSFWKVYVGFSIISVETCNQQSYALPLRRISWKFVLPSILPFSIGWLCKTLNWIGHALPLKVHQPELSIFLMSVPPWMVNLVFGSHRTKLDWNERCHVLPFKVQWFDNVFWSWSNDRSKLLKVTSVMLCRQRLSNMSCRLAVDARQWFDEACLEWKFRAHLYRRNSLQMCLSFVIHWSLTWHNILLFLIGCNLLLSTTSCAQSVSAANGVLKVRKLCWEILVPTTCENELNTQRSALLMYM